MRYMLMVAFFGQGIQRQFIAQKHAHLGNENVPQFPSYVLYDDCFLWSRDLESVLSAGAALVVFFFSNFGYALFKDQGNKEGFRF